MKITKQEYETALQLIKAYEKQLQQEFLIQKAEKYKDLTTNDIKVIEGKNARTLIAEYYVFITRNGVYVNDEADAIIDGNVFNLECTIRGGRKVYSSFDEAYKQVIKNFKKDGKIS